MAKDEGMQALAEQLADAMTPEQRQAFLDAVLTGGLRSITGDLGDLLQTADPDLREVPARVRGFRVRLDLLHATPPLWRRLELPGDLTLYRLHLVIQDAMGWTDSHLHRFRTGSDHRAPGFVTRFDLEEGEEGVLEDGVRLDQVLARTGDRLWYEYDFGDGWEHVLAVEEVMDGPPERARCLDGRRACPPEDCGGIGGYTELAEWVAGGCRSDAVPEPFDDAEQVRDWLPEGWDPDRFDAAEVNDALALTLAPPVPVAAELAELRDQLERREVRVLTRVLARSGEPAEVGEADAARLLEPFEVLLDVIGDGVRLTAAGYLPPAVVEQIADRTGVTRWWIGKANREDLTWPVAELRDTARSLGLVSVRKGVLAPTAVAKRHGGRSQVLLRHVVTRLPLGRTGFDRQAGWMTLAVVASGSPPKDWDHEIRDLLLLLGWRMSGGPRTDYIPVTNPTLRAVELLGGGLRRRWMDADATVGSDAAVVATARAAIAP